MESVYRLFKGGHSVKNYRGETSRGRISLISLVRTLNLGMALSEHSLRLATGFRFTILSSPPPPSSGQVLFFLRIIFL
jgi:hypothetical protein